MNRRLQFQEDVPMGILRRPNEDHPRPAHEVRMVDASDLPSINFDPGTIRFTTRRRNWTQLRSAVASETALNLPSRNVFNVGFGDEATLLSCPDGETTSEQRANLIVNEMGRDSMFMDDNPQAEQLRMETLKEMPESLTMKRTIRRNLINSVNQKSKLRPVSLWKRFKFGISSSLSKINLGLRNFLSHFGIWYQSLKTIEGHFGSGVATYFNYLRWLFLLDVTFCIMSVGFVVIPQLLYRLYGPPDGQFASNPVTTFYEFMEENSTQLLVPITAIPITTVRSVLELRSDPYQMNEPFKFEDIFTGEGFFTNTTLFYGFYANETLYTSTGVWYSIPNAYFFTAFACVVFVFIMLSVSMARSYRRSFIETAVGLKNIYAHKIFCGWDFSIATNEAAQLKTKSIYNELKELLGDQSLSSERESRALQHVYTPLLIQIAFNLLCLVLIGGIGALMWMLLVHNEHSMVVSIVMTLIMIFAPMLFSWIIRFEDYHNPRTGLYVTLVRTFLLEIVVVGVLVGFWLSRSKTDQNCWETSLAQEVYRFVFMDFVFAIIGTAVAETVRSKVVRRFRPLSFFNVPEFDIARNTLNLIYNQTLFWMGAFFSPLLSVIIVIKVLITFYVKKLCLLQNCQPSSRSWRAAQTQTLFLVLSFLSLLGVVVTYSYILTQVHPSASCGPFRGYDYMYEMILGGVFQLKPDNIFWKIIMYLTRPGVVAGIMIAMCVGVYYLRARSQARQELVAILREMLLVEAKDKEFLLSSISKVTEGQWMYNMANSGPSSSAAGDQPFPSTSSFCQEQMIGQPIRNQGALFRDLSRQSLGLTDEESEDYESAKIRRLRRKHIK